MLKDAINLHSLRRVLVIKLRHHGDVLLASPVFFVLKNYAPHLEIDALVYQDTAEILSLHPSINKVYGIDRQWKQLGLWQRIKAEWGLASQLRHRDYDLVIHLTDHPRAAWLVNFIGARYRVAPKLEEKRFGWDASFTHLYPLPKTTPRHTVEKHLDALRRIGIYPTENERRLVLVPGSEAENAITTLLAQHGLTEKNFIHLHPASRWQFKCWDTAKTAELINQLQLAGYKIVLTAAPDPREKELINRILKSVDSQPINLCGQLTLKQVAALTAKAKLFIGVDSAPMHIAAAMQTPVIALFGPSGEIEWAPWQVPHRIVISNQYPCRPCGNDGCGGGKVSECLTTISVEQVLSAINDLLSTTSSLSTPYSQPLRMVT